MTPAIFPSLLLRYGFSVHVSLCPLLSIHIRTTRVRRCHIAMPVPGEYDSAMFDISRLLAIDRSSFSAHCMWRCGSRRWMAGTRSPNPSCSIRDSWPSAQGCTRPQTITLTKLLRLSALYTSHTTVSATSSIHLCAWNKTHMPTCSRTTQM